jgi:hypothetical protein
MVLSVPGCPNLPLLEQRLAEALAGRPAVTVRRVIASAGEAAQCGMCGSPTLLVNGHDPFAVPGTGPALACRMYPGEGGRLEGAPTVEALRRALERAGIWASRRAGAAGRLAPAESVLWAVPQEALPASAATGRPPAAPARNRRQGFSSLPELGTRLPPSLPSGPAARSEGDRSM